MKKWQMLLIYIGIAIAPLVIMVAISLAGYFANIFNFWINPQGIRNVDIFLFSASYIAGICTLVAFLFTIDHNKKSQDAVFEENKKQLAYQSVLQSIAEEKQALSHVILGLHVRKLRDVLVDYLSPAIPSEQRLSNVQTMLSSLATSMNSLAESHTRLSFETEIKDSDCENCKNEQTCALGKIKIEFREKYKEIFEVLGITFVDTYEYISINTINMQNKLEQISLESQRSVVIVKFNNAEDKIDRIRLSGTLTHPTSLKELDMLVGLQKEYEKQIELINKNIELVVNKIDLEKESLYQGKVVEASKVISNIEDKGYHELINLGKHYIRERKSITKRQLHGEKILCFESAEQAK